jgi:uncharacterized protein YvpB
LLSHAGALGFEETEPRLREGYNVRNAACVLAALATLVSSLSGFAPPAAAQTSELSHVGGWATLGSVTPAAGCLLDASIEVREASAGISDVTVGVNLVHDGEVVWADWGMTDADGLAYLSVDTSWAAPGYEAWMDVLVGGEYAGGMPVSITDSGGCADNPDVVELSADVPVAQQSATAQNWSTSNSGASDAVRVGVPTYAQQRNLSCEYAALVMAMGTYGLWVSEYALDDVVGWSENPHWGYRGDINGWWGNTDDYGVYASALAPALPTFGFYGEEFYAQGNSTALTARLDAGTPVLVWLGLWGDTGFYNYSADGTPYKLVTGLHVVVVDGYDSGGVYVSDPATGGMKYYDWSTFMTFWNVMDGMGLSVSPL